MPERLPPHQPENLTPQQLNAKLIALVDRFPKVSLSEEVLEGEGSVRSVNERRVNSAYNYRLLEQANSLVAKANITDSFRHFITETLIITMLRGLETDSDQPEKDPGREAAEYLIENRQLAEEITKALSLPAEKWPIILATMLSTYSHLYKREEDATQPETGVPNDEAQDNLFFLDRGHPDSGGIFKPSSAIVLERMAVNKKALRIEALQRLRANFCDVSSKEEPATDYFRQQWEEVTKWEAQITHHYGLLS